jgi:hypothetical protein
MKHCRSIFRATAQRSRAHAGRQIVPDRRSAEASSKGNARQSANFVQRGIHQKLLKVVTLATLADPNSARVIRFLGLILWRIAGAFECFATSVCFEGVLATRSIIRIAFGIVRFTFGNFVVFHIIGLVRVNVAFRLSLPRPSHELRRTCLPIFSKKRTRLWRAHAKIVASLMFDRSSSGSNPSPIAFCRRTASEVSFSTLFGIDRQHYLA